MIESVYAVLLHGDHVGVIRRRDSFTAFVFDRDYWDRSDREVLGRWFESHPRRRPHAVNRVPAWFSNLLPEGRLRDLVIEKPGGRTRREIDLLVWAGRDLPGAVEVVADETADRPGGPVGGPCADARSAGRSASFERRGFALAGMTMKLSMSRQGDRLVVPAHGQDGDWILKTPDREYPGLPTNEFAIMRLAKAIGIDVPEVELWPRDDIDDLGPGVWTSGEPLAYVVRRFDRSPGGRIHIEDFAQVLGCFGAGEEKYRSTVESLAAIAYRGRDHASLREMVRRTVFNLLIGNGDAHLKNWSLIYPDRKIARLSPAYDLVCTAAYPDHADLGLPFFGTARLSEISRDHFVRLQAGLNVDDDDVLNVVDEMIDRFSSAWAAGAAERVPSRVAAWIEEHLERIRQQLAQE